MKRALSLTLVTLVAVATVAAERNWQTGIWLEIKVTRPKVVIGLRPSPYGPGPHVPRMTEVRTYVIETVDQRFELADPTPAKGRTVDALAGEKVTFAVDKNTIYVRDADGTEHRLRVTRKTAKSKG